MTRLKTLMAGNKTAILLGATLLAGAIFKLSAFAREAFVTSHFGLTALTDTYFAIQLLPLTLATFMFGAFSRAFTPAYAASIREEGRASWLPGLLFYSTLAGLGITVVTLFLSTQVLNLIAPSSDRHNYQILAILAGSYLPIVFIGICAAIWMSYGRSLISQTIAGLPYLVMTVSLVGISFAGHLGGLSLPVSMTAGFSVVGIWGIVSILAAEKPFRQPLNVLHPWRFAGFRRFCGQLAASSVETLAYSASQFAAIYFLARAGVGAVSANNCATRIGMIGFSLLAQPITLFIQARLCLLDTTGRKRAIGRYLTGMAISAALFAGILCVFRVRATQLIYMRGSFSQAAMNQVVEMLPAWLAYFVVLSLNSVASRFLFTESSGSRYSSNMLWGYALTNCLRLVSAGHLPAPWIIWWAVIGEGIALLFNLYACLSPARLSAPVIDELNLQGVAA